MVNRSPSAQHTGAFRLVDPLQVSRRRLGSSGVGWFGWARRVREMASGSNTPLLIGGGPGYDAGMSGDNVVGDGALVEDGDGREFRLCLIDTRTADPEKVAFIEPRDDGWVRDEPDPEERERTLREGLAAVAEYEAEFGAFTEEEKTWASGLLDSLGIGTKR